MKHSWFFAVCLTSLLLLTTPAQLRATDRVSLDQLVLIAPVMDDTRLAQVAWSGAGDQPADQTPSHRFGGWGGFAPGFFFPDLSGFSGMTEDRGLGGFSAPLTVWSGRGFVSLGNLRLGGMGGGGHVRKDEIIGDDHRWAEFDIFWGGLTLDLQLPLGDRLDIILGGLLGGGGIWMSADGADLCDYWSQAETFDLYAPEAGISYKILPWLRLEATAQYLFLGLDSHGSSFYASNGDRMVDLDSLSGPVYSVWLLFGYGR
jgi:hypothetical protein